MRPFLFFTGKNELSSLLTLGLQVSIGRISRKMHCLLKYLSLTDKLIKYCNKSPLSALLQKNDLHNFAAKF